MAGRTQWKRYGLALLILCLLVGIDIYRRPEGTANYSLVDAVSAATKPGTSVVGLIASDYDQLENPAPRDAALSEAQVEEMVRYAVAMAGGLRQRIEPDAEWVVIKVNIVELKERGSGIITDWRVVKALIKIIHEIVPDARVTITEGAAEWISPESPPAQVGREIERVDGFAKAGFRQLLDDPDLEGVDLDILDLNFDEVAEVEVPDGGYAQDKWKLPLVILENDFLITVPVLKIHDTISMTNAMKNFIGVAPGLVYGWPKMSGYPPRSGNPGIPHNSEILDETITDVVAASEPDFALVDAIMCMERAKTDAFGGGKQVRMNAILASADVVAADAVSARLIGLNPFDLEYLTLAAHKGLGQVDFEHIKVKGSSLDQVAVRFEKTPSGWGRGHYGQGCRIWVLKGPFERQQQKAGEEFIDVANPQALPGENGWSPAVYFHDDRIDLDKYYDDPFDCVVYAYAEFDAEKSQEAELWVGSDEGMKVWINGETVYEHEGRRRHRLPNDREMVRVEEGKNTLLVRADQGRSRYDFNLNICEPEADSRYDGSRVWGLKFTVPVSDAPVAAAGGEIRVEEEDDQEIPADAEILEGVTVPRSNDRLLGALTGSLNFLGEELSPTRLMGVSGHAFRFSMADSLGYSGLWRIDLEEMAELYANLGYQVRAITATEGDADFVRKQQEAWEGIEASLARGVPVVARLGWGHRLIVGYHPKKEQYYAVSSRGGVSQYEIDELGASDGRWGGGLEVLLLGEKQPVDPRVAERLSLQFAIAEAHRPDVPGTPYHNGFRAYECWIADVEEGRVDSERRLGYANGLLVEARTAAGEFLKEMATHYSGKTADRLKEAGECYDREAGFLGELAEIFPYRGRAQVSLEDPQASTKVASLIREAYTWEQKGVALLEEALSGMQ